MILCMGRNGASHFLLVASVLQSIVHNLCDCVILSLSFIRNVEEIVPTFGVNREIEEKKACK